MKQYKNHILATLLLILTMGISVQWVQSQTVQQALAIPNTPAHDDPLIGFAINRIKLEYGHAVFVNRKTLEKFGYNEAVGASQECVNSWGACETFQTSNVTLKVSSSSASDTGVVVNFEYMTISSGVLTFGSSTVTLDGSNSTTKVDLPVAAGRWTRAYTSTDVVGDIYFYRDGTTTTPGIPDDLSLVHLHIPAGENQSQKSGTSIASTNYFLLEHYWADIVKKTGSSCSIRLQMKSASLANAGFRTVPRRGASSETGLSHRYFHYRVVPPNTDIRFTANCTAADTIVAAGMEGLFADIL